MTCCGAAPADRARQDRRHRLRSDAGALSEYFPRNYVFWRPERYLPLYRWSARILALVLTTTNAAKNDIMKAFGVPESKIRYAPQCAHTDGSLFKDRREGAAPANRGGYE